MYLTFVKYLPTLVPARLWAEEPSQNRFPLRGAGQMGGKSVYCTKLSVPQSGTVVTFDRVSNIHVMVTKITHIKSKKGWNDGKLFIMN